MGNERRRFHRIHFDATCELHQGNSSFEVQLIDISLHGVLLAPMAQDIEMDPGDEACIVIYLANDIMINMPVRLRHIEHGHYGFVALKMELESISHLRRLVELNLGDEHLLERELEMMVLTHQA